MVVSRQPEQLSTAWRLLLEASCTRHSIYLSRPDPAVCVCNSLEAGSLEKERRLAYVGITRARQTLTLTYAGQRRVGGEEAEREPSRFLEELPAEVIDWVRPTDASDAATRQARGRAHLDALKQMLAREE